MAARGREGDLSNVEEPSSAFLALRSYVTHSNKEEAVGLCIKICQKISRDPTISHAIPRYPHDIPRTSHDSSRPRGVFISIRPIQKGV